MSLCLTPSAYITHHLATWWPCFESLAPLHSPVSRGWSWQRLREHPGKPSPNSRAPQAQASLLCLQTSSAPAQPLPHSAPGPRFCHLCPQGTGGRAQNRGSRASLHPRNQGWPIHSDNLPPASSRELVPVGVLFPARRAESWAHLSIEAFT